MQKPVKSEGLEIQAGYDFHEVIHYINEKYNIDAYDMLGSNNHFNTWANAKGFTGKDPDGEPQSSSRIWFAQYNADPQGNAACPEYQDFIGWFVDFYPYDYDESFSVLIDYHLEQEIPDFVRTILGFIQDEFGNDVEFYYSEA